MKKLAMKQTIIVVVAITVLLGPGVVFAQDTSPVSVDRAFNVQLFEPALGHDAFFTVESARSTGHLAVTAGFLIGYQHNPFSVIPCRQGTGGEGQPECDLDRDSPNVMDVVSSHLEADFFATLTIFDMAQFGLSIPVVLYQAGDGVREQVDGEWVNTPLGGSTSLGDIRLHIKWTAPFGLGRGENQGFGLAIAPVVTFPVGNAVVSDSFMGDSMVTVHPQILGEYRYSGLQITARVGYRWREEKQIYSTVVGDQLTFGAAVGYTFNLDRPGFSLRPLIEVSGANGFTTDLSQSPLEIGAGLQARIAGDFILSVGGGAGLVAAVGVPQFRVFAGFSWAPIRGDSDGDGIDNSEDSCPHEAEDRDGFADEDGCPEIDNDGDGMEDGDDQCPDDAEDIDEYQDDDGCPDEDNDGDGVNDGYDTCPMEAEDPDGYEDDDGCPDLDHDGDNINEPADHCPYEQEDTDGFGDMDGCPETDFDGDGVGDDEGDYCPEEAEDRDGFEDDDGCPDLDNDGDMNPDATDRCPRRREVYNTNNDSDGCPEGGRNAITIEENLIRLNVQPEFAPGTAQLVGRTTTALLEIMQTVINLNPDKQFRIEVHYSGASNAEQNTAVSQRRGEAIKRWLVGRGVDEARLVVQGFGASQQRSPAVNLRVITDEDEEPVEDAPEEPAGDAESSGGESQGSGEDEGDVDFDFE